MKDQYFGDFGDYQKFSLLKILRDIGGFKITVHWMKTHNDESSDGSKITYLKDPSIWRSYDSEIFDFIKGHIDGGRRELGLYEASVHALNIRFINDRIEDPVHRQKLRKCIQEDKASDLIFFDPDNGIEVKSTTVKNLYKYVTWEDIQTAYELRKNVLVYQHFSRMNRDMFIQAKVAEIKEHLSANPMVIKVKNSVYFLVLQKTHESKAKEALKEYQSIWGGIVSVRD